MAQPNIAASQIVALNDKQSLGFPNIEDWPTLRSRLIAKFKPNYKLLENFRSRHLCLFYFYSLFV